MIEEKIYLNLGKITLFVFICCSIIIGIVGFDIFTAKARDIKRRVDMGALVEALDLYHLKYGRYPEAVDEWRGWDVSYAVGGKGDFLKILKDDGFLKKSANDPVNDTFNHYRYQRHERGGFGCERPFYILQVTAFETADGNRGRGECPDFNWAAELPNGYTIQRFE